MQLYRLAQDHLGSEESVNAEEIAAEDSLVGGEDFSLGRVFETEDEEETFVSARQPSHPFPPLFFPNTCGGQVSPSFLLSFSPLLLFDMQRKFAAPIEDQDQEALITIASLLGGSSTVAEIQEQLREDV